MNFYQWQVLSTNIYVCVIMILFLVKIKVDVILRIPWWDTSGQSIHMNFPDFRLHVKDACHSTNRPLPLINKQWLSIKMYKCYAGQLNCIVSLFINFRCFLEEKRNKITDESSNERDVWSLTITVTHRKLHIPTVRERTVLLQWRWLCCYISITLFGLHFNWFMLILSHPLNLNVSIIK